MSAADDREAKLTATLRHLRADVLIEAASHLERAAANTAAVPSKNRRAGIADAASMIAGMARTERRLAGLADGIVRDEGAS